MRIGIVTMYHKSYNYGGVLQAFALCKFINDELGQAEQIDFDTKRSNGKSKKNLKYVVRSIVNFAHMKRMKKRYERFDAFREEIPHSIRTYTNDTYRNIPGQYDIVITGSDQVWNFKWFNKAYFLDFDGCKKISYAASFGMKSLSAEQSEYLRSVLANYEAISVREKDSISLIERVSKDVVQVLDPVFLLQKEDWSSFASEKMIQKPYVYCHFIGNDIKSRKIAKEFARRKGYRVIVLPHPSHLNVCDLFYGTNSMISASPRDFVSLIQNAEYVFTDSFHCCAFSVIFEKQFYVFHRRGEKEMSSRIESLVKMVNSPERFVRDTSNLSSSWEKDIDDIEYKTVEYEIEKARTFSRDYLLNALKNAKSEIEREK